MGAIRGFEELKAFDDLKRSMYEDTDGDWITYAYGWFFEKFILEIKEVCRINVPVSLTGKDVYELIRRPDGRGGNWWSLINITKGIRVTNHRIKRGEKV